MDRRHWILSTIGALAMAGVLVTTTASYAQTSGMERRGERRENRDGARDEKRECKAGDEKTRPECRQDKRDTKQEGRHDGDDEAKPEDGGQDS